MTIEKSSCIVLSVMSYRESSAIATLLSRGHGRVSGIAKGIRRPPSPLLLERGQIVECMLYIRPHRDLHTMAQISVTEYFPAIRSSLGRLALRDAAFELALKSVSASETHPELHDYAAAFLRRLEACPAAPLPVHLLWCFIAGWSRLLGFKLNLAGCVRCGSGSVSAEGGTLSLKLGGLLCSACSGGATATGSFLQPAVVALLQEEQAGGAGFPISDFSAAEQLRVTLVLTDYFRYHLDIGEELRSIAFLRTMLEPIASLQ